MSNYQEASFKMELRPAEVGGIMAGAAAIEIALSSSDYHDLVDNAIQEAYTHSELEELDAETIQRFQDLYWAQVSMKLAERYLLHATIPFF